MAFSDDFLKSIIKWIDLITGNSSEENGDLIYLSPLDRQNFPESNDPEIAAIIKKIVDKSNAEIETLDSLEFELKAFPDFDETKFFLDAQDLLKDIIADLNDNGLIKFFSLEIGIIISCPHCEGLAEVKVEAKDYTGCRYFLIQCLEGISLWVDHDFLKTALEKRIKEYAELRKKNK